MHFHVRCNALFGCIRYIFLLSVCAVEDPDDYDKLFVGSQHYISQVLYIFKKWRTSEKMMRVGVALCCIFSHTLSAKLSLMQLIMMLRNSQKQKKMFSRKRMKEKYTQKNIFIFWGPLRRKCVVKVSYQRKKNIIAEFT
jgi:hypothetical protein